MIASTILVILMTLPGLALFYGGLVRTKKYAVYTHSGICYLLCDRIVVGHLWLQSGIHSRRRIEQLYRRLLKKHS